jgi:chromate reductase, NAD(P)H dehydrogenase (quinone)
MITIIAGTNRKNSYSLKVANIYQQLLAKHSIEHQVLSLEQLPHDFIFTQLQTQTTEYTSFISQYIEQAEKFVFIIPEYNGSFPGVLKAFVDTVPPKFFRGKKSCLVGVSSGHLGSVRGLDDFTDILHYLGVEVLSNKPKFSGIEKIMDDNGQFIDVANVGKLSTQLEKFNAF